MFARPRRFLRAPSTRPPLRRLVWTLAQLRAGRPLKATDVAAKFEVGLRTAYRDLDFLRDGWGTPFEWDHAVGSYRLTQPTVPLPPIVLTEGELIALYFAEKVVRQYRGTPYEKDLASAFQKLQVLLPAEVTVEPDRILSYLELDTGPLPDANPAIFREVVAGLTRGRRLVIRYASASSGTTLDRTVDPYRVFNRRGNWYLVAWDHRRRAVRDFALHRIRRVTITDERSDPPSRFDFRAYMADSFQIEKGGRPVNVAIRFSPRQARWIRERRWHRTARVQERLDGGCVLRMRVAGLGEVKRWVMQFGPEAEVLAPKALRSALARELRAAASAYGRVPRVEARNGAGGERE